MAEKTTDVATPESQRLARRERLGHLASPIGMLGYFADEMDRIFEDFGFGRRNWLSSRPGQNWAPAIEVQQRNNEMVVRADLPGMKKDDISVEVTQDAITISGERHQEHETERGGVYRSERSYGSFYRAIPLPEGAIADQAKATFNDGVLEVTVPAPPEQVSRGRRLEIAEAKK